MADYQNTGLSVWEAAAIATGCSACPPPCELAPFGDTTVLDNGTLNLQWIVFRSLYLSLRQQALRRLQAEWQVEHNCFNDCYDRPYAYGLLDSVPPVQPENGTGLILYQEPVSDGEHCYFVNDSTQTLPWVGLSGGGFPLVNDHGQVTFGFGGLQISEPAPIYPGAGTGDDPITATGVAFLPDTCACTSIMELYRTFPGRQDFGAFTAHYNDEFSTNLTVAQVMNLMEGCTCTAGMEVVSCEQLMAMYNTYFPRGDSTGFANLFNAVHGATYTPWQVFTMIKCCKQDPVFGGGLDSPPRCIFQNPFLLMDEEPLDCDTVKELLEAGCDTACRSYSGYWRQKLSGCITDEVVMDQVIERMIAICKAGCDPVHGLGSSNLPPGESTVFGDSSFFQLLSQETGCNPWLIGFPREYGYAMTGEVMGQMDSCTCRLANEAYAEFATKGTGDFLDFTKFFNQEYNTAISLTELKSLLCICNDGVDTVHLCDPEQPLTLMVPNEIRCDPCVACSTVEAMLGDFMALYPDTQMNFYNASLIQNYLNNRLGFNLNYTEYISAMDTGMVQCADDDALLCNHPLFPALPEGPSCYEEAAAQALQTGEFLYAQYLDSVREALDSDYVQTAMNGPAEKFTMTYVLLEGYYTLYYYDRAGNLLRTVPPEGVHPIRDTSLVNQVHRHRLAPGAFTAVYPAHTMGSKYLYNTYDSPVKVITPDGGTDRSWYDRQGRVVAGQRAAQSAEDAYTYTVYDRLGRPVETGALTTPAPLNDAIASDSAAMRQWIAAGDPEGRIATQYDSAVFEVPGFTAENLRNRVASVACRDKRYGATFRTHYSYDLHGNVKSVVQENTLMPQAHGFKRTDYEYDLVSGNIRKVVYQREKEDQFTHRYAYDADNRLQSVKTGVDGVEWERDGAYTYYRHGALARTELGGLRVQGLDYAYTLQGWLKAINSGILDASADMGMDGNQGLPGNPHRYIGRDAFGFVLQYNNSDYVPVNGFMQHLTQTGGSDFQANSRELFNGNIPMTIQQKQDEEVMGKSYRYDVLNRLRSSDIYTNFDAMAGQWLSNGVFSGEYGTSYRYDLNGNIMNLMRNGTLDTALSMDRLTYHYEPGSNRLVYVEDSVADPVYHTDLDSQSPGNYAYDASGNLLSDDREQISCTWSWTGKMERVLRTGSTVRPNVSFYYDGAGNRVMKELEGDSALWYVYGADNSLMAIYSVPAALLQKQRSVELSGVMVHGIKTFPQGGFHTLPGGLPGGISGTEPVVRVLEYPIYGTEKLGSYEPRRPLRMDTTATPPGDTVHLHLHRGDRRYPLTDHLGNVQALLSGRKQGIDADNDSLADYYRAVVLSRVGYYPFGSQMPGRSFNAGDYRYSFQGQEHDDEIKGQGNSINYAFRMQDPRLGRFMSIDPLVAKFPHWSPYNFSGNQVIATIELEGLEPAKDFNLYEEQLDTYRRWSSRERKMTTESSNTELVSLNEPGKFEIISKSKEAENVAWKTQAPDWSACKKTCDLILSGANIKQPALKKNSIQIALENESKNELVATKNFDWGISEINKSLDKGEPIEVGVNHTFGKRSNEGTTDHFVVLTGREYDYDREQYFYSFLEVGTSHRSQGTSWRNRLYLDKDRRFLSGSTAYNSTKIYTVSQVRVNYDLPKPVPFKPNGN